MSSVTFSLRVFPNSIKPFIVYSDASKVSLSDILMLKDLKSQHSLVKRVENETMIMDYNFNLSHHLGNANVVVNALSRKYSYVYALMISRMITHEKKIGVKRRTNEVMRFYIKIHVLDVTKLRRATTTYQNLIGMFEWTSLKEEKTRIYLEILIELLRALETKVKIDNNYHI
ncbi:hypothetical protein CR513_27802, partial [Mucuna pruriens]